MIAIRKKIVTDEDHNPVEVVINYDDWLEIERLLGLQPGKKLLTDLSAFRGVITMTEDALEYQRRIRAEWDREWDEE
ncbi:MAG: hypothetical protein H0U31_01275 [Chloroflexia bacterium]|nr:hypothetical protein [Chloroflexia bacterium]MDQ3547434.1 hypothetical protein [Chloroflexota bacterium]